MEDKYINRYHTFCNSLKKLEKSRRANPKADFVAEGTVMNFALTFDIAWKVMKDILVKKMEILDFATESPRETLEQAFTNGIMDDDRWLEMLRTRNRLAHDYDGSLAVEKFHDIIEAYYSLLEKFREKALRYYGDTAR